MPQAPAKLNSYDDVKKLLNAFLVSSGTAIPGKHGVFWNVLTYLEFRDGNVPHVVDPTTHAPFKILVVGKPNESNLILALRGVGPIFNNDTGTVTRMPLFGPPWMPDEQIDALADWIKRDCPDPSNPHHKP